MALDDAELKIVVRAATSELVAQMQQAAGVVQGAFAQMASAIQRLEAQSTASQRTIAGSFQAFWGQIAAASDRAVEQQRRRFESFWGDLDRISRARQLTIQRNLEEFWAQVGAAGETRARVFTRFWEQVATASLSSQERMRQGMAAFWGEVATVVTLQQQRIAQQAALLQSTLGGIGGSLVRLAGQVLATGGIIGGGFALRSVIRDTQQWAFDVEELSRRLGLNMREASAWAGATRLSGASVDTVTSAVARLVQTVATNEKAFQQNRIAIRGEGDALLPLSAILTNTIARYDSLTTAQQQAFLARALFGRGVSDITDLQRFVGDLTEAREVVQAFGLELGPGGVKASRDFDQAMDRVRLAILGAENVVASALRPEIERLFDEIVRLARDGTLAEWARDGAKLIRDLGRTLVDVGGFVRDHAGLVRLAAEAWVAYRAGLILEATWRTIAAGIELATAALKGQATAATLSAGPWGLLAAAIGLAAFETYRWMQARAEADAKYGASATGIEAATQRQVREYDRLIAATIKARDEATNPAGRAQMEEHLRSLEKQRAALLAKGQAARDAALAGETPAPPPPEPPLPLAPGLRGTGDDAAQREAFQRAREAMLLSARNNAAERLRIEELFAARAAVLFGQTSDEYAAQQLRVQQAAQAAGDERRRLVETGAQASLKLQLDAIDLERVQLGERRKRHEITDADEFRALQDLLARKFALQRGFLERTLALEAGGAERLAAIRARLATVTTPEERTQVVIEAKLENPEAFTQALAGVEALDAAWQKALADLRAQSDPTFKNLVRSADEVRSAFQFAFSAIDTAFNQVVQGIFQGTQTLEDVVNNAATNMAVTGINAARHFLFEVGKLQLLRLAAHLLGNQKIVDAERLSGEERLALSVGNWLLETLGFKAKEEEKTRALAEEMAKRQALEAGAAFVGPPVPGTELPGTAVPGAPGTPAAPGSPGAPAGTSSALARPVSSLTGTANALGGFAAGSSLVATAQDEQNQLTAIAEQGEQQRQAVTQRGLAQQVAALVASGVRKVANWVATNATMLADSIRSGAQDLAQLARNALVKLGIITATEAAIVTEKKATGAIVRSDSGATAVAEVTNAAYGAATKSAEAVADTPYVGPILAILNFAAVLAALLASVSSLVTSEEGLDEAPGGAGHLLHPRETKLSPRIAETIRALAAAGTRLGEGDVVDVGSRPQLTSLPKGAMVVPARAGLADLVRDMVAGRSGGASRAGSASPALVAEGGLDAAPSSAVIQQHAGEVVTSPRLGAAFRSGPSIRIATPSLNLGATFAQVERQVAAAQAEAPAEGGGAVVHLSAPITVHALDGANVRDVYQRTARHLVEAVENEARRRGPSRRQP